MLGCAQSNDFSGGWTSMVGVRQALLVTASVLVLGTTAEAKTLVYCSEGSPEGFNPQLYTSGTTFDAGSRPVYNRLIEVERGTTTLQPALAESWAVSDDGRSYTFKLRAEREVPATKGFTPTPRRSRPTTCCSRSTACSTRSTPTTRYRAAPTSTSTAWAWPTCSKSVEKVDDYTVKFTLKHPDAPFLADMAHGLRLDPLGGIRRQDDEGRHAREGRPRPDRHRAVLARLPTRRTR